MSDLYNLPRPDRSDVQVFTRPSTVNNLQWLTWLKPRGVSMLNIFVVGGGAGGGGGFTGAAAAARGGGGGGGGSGIVRVLLPAYLCPDRLYIQVGAGGVGVGSGGGVASSGILSLVTIHPNTATENVLAISSGAAPAGGTTGTGAAGGAGGAGGTVAAIANMPLASWGVPGFITGQSGAAGGAQTGANGAALSIPNNGQLCMGGSGGGGVTAADFAGGAINAVANTFLSEQRPATPAAGSFDGSGGVNLLKPFLSLAALGGSSSNAGIGGLGGLGHYGGGGGGGGGGTTGGKGGDGGSGIVIIIAW